MNAAAASSVGSCCYLYEKGKTEAEGRVIVVYGTGVTAEGSLQEAIYEAETSELL